MGLDLTNGVARQIYSSYSGVHARRTDLLARFGWHLILTSPDYGDRRNHVAETGLDLLYAVNFDDDFINDLGDLSTPPSAHQTAAFAKLLADMDVNIDYDALGSLYAKAPGIPLPVGQHFQALLDFCDHSDADGWHPPYATGAIGAALTYLLDATQGLADTTMDGRMRELAEFSTTSGAEGRPVYYV